MCSRYLNLHTEFSVFEFYVLNRTVSFHADSYIEALNGNIGDGAYLCTLKSGDPFVKGQVYDTLEEFEYCATESGGFTSLDSLATTFNDTTVYVYSGYNGRCGVVYGLMPDPAPEPLESDFLSVGGRLFYRLGNVSCTLGKPRVSEDVFHFLLFLRIMSSSC